MRRLYNTPLLEKIEENPLTYIIQRSVPLLDAFTMGYELTNLEIENIDILNKKHKDTPSTNEYASTKYKRNIGSKNFSCLIAYTCEGELDFFYQYLAFLKEYDQAYALDQPIKYIPVERSKTNL